MKKTIVLKRYGNLESNLKEKGFKPSVKRYKDYRTVGVELRDSEISELSKHVFEEFKLEYEKNQVSKYIRKLGKNLFDLKKLSCKVREYIAGEKELEGFVGTEYRVLEALEDYIRYNTLIDLDGFIKFRLKFYKEAIMEYTDMSLADLQLERERLEFISALRYFVGSQKPKAKEVSIILEEKGYKMVDKDKNTIDEAEMRNIGIELGEEELDYEELIMGTLITTAPEKIHIYRDKSVAEDLVSTIEEVFKGKVRHV